MLGLRNGKCEMRRTGCGSAGVPNCVALRRTQTRAKNSHAFLRISHFAFRSAFTLIELLVTIAIIAILAAIVAPAVFRNVGDAKASAARSQIEILALALYAYRLDNDDYPSVEQGLSALRTLPTVGEIPRNWRGPYLRRTVPLDPWGRPYVYVVPGRANPSSFDLYSLGRDAEIGGEGENADVTSWGDAVQP